MKVSDIIFPVGIGFIVAISISLIFFAITPEDDGFPNQLQKSVTAEGILTDFDVTPSSFGGFGSAKFVIGGQTILSKGDVDVQLVTGKCYVLYEGQDFWGNIKIEESKN